MVRRKQFMILLIISVILVGCQNSEVEGNKDTPSSSGEGQDQPAATPEILDPTPETIERIEATPALVRGKDYLLARAVSDLSTRLGVSEDDIQVVRMEAVEWSDSSLGCPAEGMDYAQVITPGYEITLQVDEVEYRYHSDKDQFMVLCSEDGIPKLLPIPIQPGDKIQDGSPWMPVD